MVGALQRRSSCSLRRLSTHPRARRWHRSVRRSLHPVRLLSLSVHRSFLHARLLRLRALPRLSCIAVDGAADIDGARRSMPRRSSWPGPSSSRSPLSFIDQVSSAIPSWSRPRHRSSTPPSPEMASSRRPPSAGGGDRRSRCLRRWQCLRRSQCPRVGRVSSLPQSVKATRTRPRHPIGETPGRVFQLRVAELIRCSVRIDLEGPAAEAWRDTLSLEVRRSAAMETDRSPTWQCNCHQRGSWRSCLP